MLSQYFQPCSHTPQNPLSSQIDILADTSLPPITDQMPFLDLYPFDDEKKLMQTMQVGEENSIQSMEGVDCKRVNAGSVEVREVALKKYDEAVRGRKDDTAMLHVHFKAIIRQYFKECMVLKELTKEEISHLQGFLHRVPSYSSLMEFLSPTEHNSSIRQHYLQLFCSKECVKRVLKSRCQIFPKLQMLKYMEIMRINALKHNKTYNWKSSRSRRTKKAHQLSKDA